ncbi:hypothetical protein WNY37_08830 [Henriciella sp. AS95]|uniref:hypothetical protein n=1 Tax=Henriciella sp. AS95 TaxID=3135782 RepID=UPI003170CF56
MSPRHKSLRRISVFTAPLVFAFPGWSQIATSNEDGATGAYSSEVDSSFVAEGRFGPRTAIDDLRANVDRDRETVERIRLQQLRELRPEAPVEGPPPPPAAEDGDSPVPDSVPAPE